MAVKTSEAALVDLEAVSVAVTMADMEVLEAVLEGSEEAMEV